MRTDQEPSLLRGRKQAFVLLILQPLTETGGLCHALAPPQIACFIPKMAGLTPENLARGRLPNVTFTPSTVAATLEPSSSYTL